MPRGAIDPVDMAGVEFGLEYLVYGTGIFVMEVWLFFALGLVVLSGTGMRIPYFSQAQAAPSNYELINDVEIPRSLFWLGWYITLFFTGRRADRPGSIGAISLPSVFFTW